MNEILNTGAAHIKRVFFYFVNAYVSFYAYSVVKIRIGACIGLVALPVYYFVWEYFAPQTYDNLSLRLFGSTLCLALVLRPYWPQSLFRFEIPLAYVTTVYCLPFFISFMTMMTGASIVWQLTTIASVLYMIFLFDAANAAMAIVLGVGAAAIAFALSGQTVEWPTSMVPFLLAMAFVGPSVVFLYYGDRLIASEKIAAARAMAGHVAHEIRTPLASIRFETEKLVEILNRTPSDDSTDNKSRKPTQSAAQLNASLTRVNEHTKSASLLIDIILTKVDTPGQHDNATVNNMADTIESALNNYPFKSSQRDSVITDLAKSFSYAGSSLIMSHVIYNLLKNALRAIAKKGDGTITLTLERENNLNTLTVKDTGTGIPKADLPFVFVPFFTRERGNAGTGVGLSFCRNALSHMNATIECDSIEGRYTTFKITLPEVPEQTAHEN